MLVAPFGPAAFLPRNTASPTSMERIQISGYQPAHRRAAAEAAEAAVGMTVAGELWR
jgi:hypothetical protein